MNNLDTILNYVLNDIKKRKKNEPFIIGINGVDTSGKSRFAENLKCFLIQNNYKVQTIHIDDFLNKKDYRYSGKDEVDNYYNRSFNISRLVDEILEPARNKQTINKTFKFLNVLTDTTDIEKVVDIDENTIVIFEGVFIFRDEIRRFLDYKIFIHIPFDQCKKRATNRDVPLLGPEVINKYDTKYIPTQKLYLEEYPPEEHADIIIDNTDWDKPKVIFEKYKEF